MISNRLVLGHTFLHNGSDHGAAAKPVLPPATGARPLYYPTPNFNEESRYDPDAPYNLAPRFSLPKGFGLPLARNFDYNSFVKTDVGNNTETTEKGLGLPLFIDLPNKSIRGSFQWDSFPAGEAQQFLVFSVTRELINNQPLFNGETMGATPVVLDALSSSETERPFTISLTVTPYNAGPIPHIHWAEDEWFIILQGEIDSWIGDPAKDAYELYEFPAGSEPLPSNYDGPILTSENIDTFFYNHMTSGQSVYLPRGYAHSYRNASPTGDPLVFLTIWSRTPGYPQGGIEQFFTLPDPLIGRFYDTSDKAAGYGNLYNKNVGSVDGISNQQRLVDYYNTFPDYFVAMSRNFGSFTSPDSAGGNWNPAIPYDTTTFGTPPPAYWVNDSDQPWLAGPNTPGADPYFVPPGPNAPSGSVSFATPTDPGVLQVSTFTYSGPSDSASLSQFEASLADVQKILSQASGVQYSLLLDPESSGLDPQSYVIQTTWNKYSDLHAMQGSKQLTSALNRTLTLGSVTTVNNTINSDINADNQQILVGRFQIKPGNMGQVLALSQTLKEQTSQEPGAISFDYYIDEVDQNTIVYIEHYENGPALTAHLLEPYTTSFFAQLGPLTSSGLLGDGNVGVYPVNPDISFFYPEQLQGIDLLGEILSDMPDLHLVLSADKGKLRTSTLSGTNEVGGYIDTRLSARPNSDVTFGYIDPSSDSPVVLFEADSSLRLTSEIRDLTSRKVPVISGEQLRFFRTSQSAKDVGRDGLSASATISTPRTLKVSPDGETARFKQLSISLDVPYQGIQSVTSQLQTDSQALVDLTQAPRRELTASAHLYNSAGKHLDSLTGTEYGLYKVNNTSGMIIDAITGKKINPNQAKAYQRAIDGQLKNSSLNDLLTADGGFIYAPFFKQDNEIYTPFNSNVQIAGTNSFVFNTQANSYLTAFTFEYSERIPLMP